MFDIAVMRPVRSCVNVCVLAQHRTLHSCLSLLPSRACCSQVQMHEVRNTMEQLWFTPESEDWTDEQRQLLIEFREALYECNPLCHSYVRACELRDDPNIEHHDVTFEFKHGDDGGPEVSAFVQTADADKLPPQLQ